LLWPRQSLPAASAPAPGPHTSGIELLSQTSPPASALPDHSGAFSIAGWAILRAARTLPFLGRLISASRLLDIRMSLSTLFLIADVARRRVSGLFATPDSFRLNQSPLGAFPPAPGSHSVETLRHRRFFRWLGGSGNFFGSHRFPCHSFRPHGIPNSDVSLVALL